MWQNTSGTEVMLIIEAPSDWNHLLSALLENLGPSTVMLVPVG